MIAIAMVVAMTMPLGAQQRTLDDEVQSAGAGEPSGGFPNWQERVLHQWINRARSDPQFEMARCGAACGEAKCYSPKPPLGWSDALARAARFHADEMAKQDYLAHDSKCTVTPGIAALYPLLCDGSASCGCVGGSKVCGPTGCTRWYDRVGLFGAYGTGEIIALWSNPSEAFYLWLFEASSTAACQYTIANGHRWSILQLDGVAGAGMNENIAVVDFGRGSTPAGIVSVAHYPRSGANVEIWANWYGDAPPRSATAVVNGVCKPLSLKRGTGTNGAWSVALAAQSSACDFYYVQFVAADGTTRTYPETGSFAIGAGTCGDWTASRHRSACSSSARRRAVRR